MTRARQTVLMLGAVLVTLALGLGLTVATVRLENQAGNRSPAASGSVTRVQVVIARFLLQPRAC